MVFPKAKAELIFFPFWRPVIQSWFNLINLLFIEIFTKVNQLSVITWIYSHVYLVSLSISFFFIYFRNGQTNILAYWETDNDDNISKFTGRTFASKMNSKRLKIFEVKWLARFSMNSRTRVRTPVRGVGAKPTQLFIIFFKVVDKCVPRETFSV